MNKPHTCAIGDRRTDRQTDGHRQHFKPFSHFLDKQDDPSELDNPIRSHRTWGAGVIQDMPPTEDHDSSVNVFILNVFQSI